MLIVSEINKSEIRNFKSSMEFQLPIHIQDLPRALTYRDKILLMGSCFTEHIGNRLQELKFNVLQNPNGILFDPHSVAASLDSYIHNQPYTEKNLFYLNECWQSWQHHSMFSHTSKEDCLQQINVSQNNAHNFLKTANCIIITLGSSFSYGLTDLTPGPSPKGEGGLKSKRVANCHRAPAQWFHKHLMRIEAISAVLENCIRQLADFNNTLQIIFTVSPVRHIRDGVIENNRSKARLIEVVHELVNTYDHAHYFPAYELVIDVLRDYRFYDIDMVHPNYPATEFVMEKFIQSCIDVSSRQVMEEIKKIVAARKHKPFQPATNAHKQFLSVHLEKTRDLQKRYPFLNFEEEMVYFNQ